LDATSIRSADQHMHKHKQLKQVVETRELLDLIDLLDLNLKLIKSVSVRVSD
jgi:hypothetical protein